mmetsp:Transcript_13916/g.21027  ORF Transcript_13916/g.21027 Transcript_13916/m.21027 type:complete len:114 (-) Transcript_13916:511-852(-)
MPLKRSQSSRNLAHFKPAQRRKRHGSDNSFMSVKIPEAKAPTFSSYRFNKRARTKYKQEADFDELRSDSIVSCALCKRTKLTFGFFMYLDQCFCSETCRSEAITLDEMRFLRV